MSTELQIAELRQFVGAALDELERKIGPTILLEADFYRADRHDGLYDLDAAPEMSVGSHRDELEFLRSALKDSADHERGLVVMLNYVAALLLAARQAALKP